MFIFENVELDFTNILLGIVSTVIIYFAWKSTNVRDDRFTTAVFIIENRRRLLDSIVRQPTNIVRSSSTQSDNSNATEEVEILTEQQIPEPLEDLNIPEAPSLQAIIDEVNDLASSRNTRSDYQAVEENLDDLLNDSDVGPLQIIEEMDNPDAEGLRRRRLAFYTGEGSSTGSTSNTSTQPAQVIRRENLNLPSQDSTDNSHAENCSNENNENENISKTDSKIIGNTGENPNHHQQQQQQQPQQQEQEQQQQNPDVNSEFRIKLKYLNDELRMVKGTPNEAIGDFKKRNFTVELAAQKLVRLVFNGHVLQPDSKTLQACGLFDNCVVHCLIHNKRPTPGGTDETRGTQSGQNQSSSHQQAGIGANVFLDRNSNGPFFVYLGIALVSLAIGFCWYCRVQHSYLFSWYSTIGLILMTALFLVIFPLIILIERGEY